MSEASEVLRGRAAHLITTLPDDLGAEVLVTGSVGRGVADAYSDLELSIATTNVPSIDACRAWIISHGGDARLMGHDDPRVWFDGFLRDLRIEIYWQSIGHLDRLLREVLAAETLKHAEVRTAEALNSSFALRTLGWHAHWRELLTVYPEPLRRALIEDGARQLRNAPLELALVRRADRLPLERYLIVHAEAALRVLFAINEQWEPFWKWLALWETSLTVKPPRLVPRLEAALMEPEHETALRGMLEVARDVLELVPAEYDVALALANVRDVLAKL